MATRRAEEAKPPARGRPLRFLTLVLSLWISGRIVLASSLTDDDTLLAGARLRFGTAFAETQDRPAKAIARIFHIESPGRQQIWAARIDRVPISTPPRSWTLSIDRAPVVRLAEAMAAAYPENIEISRESRSSAPDMTNSPSAPAPLPMGMAHSRRWNGSAWVFWREKGNGVALTNAGQLGGSQAGVRIDRRLANLGKNKLPVLLYGRLTAALKAPHQGEAAIGMALKPLSGRLPLTIGAERRIALDNSGRNAFALVTAGGLNPTHVVGPIMAEGYAQAGHGRLFAAGYVRRWPRLTRYAAGQGRTHESGREYFRRCTAWRFKAGYRADGGNAPAAWSDPAPSGGGMASKDCRQCPARLRPDRHPRQRFLNSVVQTGFTRTELR